MPKPLRGEQGQPGTCAKQLQPPNSSDIPAPLQTNDLRCGALRSSLTGLSRSGAVKWMAITPSVPHTMMVKMPAASQQALRS